MGIIGMRKPLKPGSVIKMPNQGQYVICEKIGEGGLSLIYSAKTKSNDYPVIIKEFFPAEHARRAEKTLRSEDGAIIEKKDRVYPDSDYADRFERCLSAFEQEGQLGSSARMNNFQIISFSDCGEGYAVLPRWSNDSCSFYDLVNGWRSSPPTSVDPVFTDLGRVQFALTAISSLLSAVSSIHTQNMLHLDISANNVVWAGHSRTTPENGTTFLTDFGCSALMTDGVYPAEYVLSYSKEYAAPEYILKHGELTCATDIYSVGRLLTFLCLGQRAFYKHSSLKDLIRKLHIQERCRQVLLAIIQKATADNMLDRYQSAAEMQNTVNGLLSIIPAHPINPDNTTAFSLYSLKSMLEGSLDTRYSWAHELCDRRGSNITLPEKVHQPISTPGSGRFIDDETFLRTVLPCEIFTYLWTQISKESDKQFYLSGIMAGNYDNEWKKEICRLMHRYGARDLLTRSQALLVDTSAFYIDQKLLFQLLGKDGARLSECYYNCNIQSAPYIGLALFIMFALLGVDGFAKLLPSPSQAGTLFFSL